MEIKISEEGVIFCDGIVCNPLSFYATNDYCGSCPLIKICDEFFDIKLDVGCSII